MFSYTETFGHSKSHIGTDPAIMCEIMSLQIISDKVQAQIWP